MVEHLEPLRKQLIEVLWWQWTQIISKTVQFYDERSAAAIMTLSTDSNL
jgi:hypothetical protein